MSFLKTGLKVSLTSGIVASGLYIASGDKHSSRVADCDIWRNARKIETNSETGYATKPIECRDGTKVFPWSAPSRHRSKR